MRNRFPPQPDTAKPMLLVRPSQAARDLLALRRSAGSKMLTSPGPDSGTLGELIRVAARVPDHRKLEPWRFIVFDGPARQKFAHHIEDIFKKMNPDATQKETELEAARPFRAPVFVAVISSPDKAHKTPVWEQELSAGAVCYNLLLAANASGWAGVWLTEWMAFDPDIAKVLGLTADERVAGFIYLGTGKAKSPERPRPDTSAKITNFADL